jgi:hypothetical protein
VGEAVCQIEALLELFRTGNCRLFSGSTRWNLTRVIPPSPNQLTLATAFGREDVPRRETLEMIAGENLMMNQQSRGDPTRRNESLNLKCLV